MSGIQNRRNSLSSLANRRRRPVAALHVLLLTTACCSLLALNGGCSSSKRFAAPESPTAGTSGATPPGPAPEPSSYRYYTYRAVTGECNCEEYRVTDERFQVEYRFRARYKMDNGIETEVEIDLKNNSRDTLFVDRAAAKVSSKNVQYTYNDKYLPLPILIIPPGDSNTLNLSGKEKTGENNWFEIAGEQFSVTLRGLRNSTSDLPPQTVTFIPENPMFPK